MIALLTGVISESMFEKNQVKLTVGLQNWLRKMSTET